jgi:hypothetical protein
MGRFTIKEGLSILAPMCHVILQTGVSVRYKKMSRRDRFATLLPRILDRTPEL